MWRRRVPQESDVACQVSSVDFRDYLDEPGILPPAGLDFLRRLLKVT
jgi:hypothetical protein